LGLFDFLKTKDTVPYEKIYEELSAFTEASLAMPKMNNPFLLDDKSKHAINFTDNDMEHAQELLKYCDDIRETDEGSNYALRGKLAMRKWVAGGPMAAYAPMGLVKILND
jgi:hypothetical protein